VVLLQLKQYKEVRLPKKKLVSPQFKLSNFIATWQSLVEKFFILGWQVSLPFEMIYDDLAEEKEFPIR
jgi:hypothetical protein